MCSIGGNVLLKRASFPLGPVATDCGAKSECYGLTRSWRSFGLVLNPDTCVSSSLLLSALTITCGKTMYLSCNAINPGGAFELQNCCLAEQDTAVAVRCKALGFWGRHPTPSRLPFSLLSDASIVQLSMSMAVLLMHRNFFRYRQTMAYSYLPPLGRL